MFLLNRNLSLRLGTIGSLFIILNACQGPQNLWLSWAALSSSPESKASTPLTLASVESAHSTQRRAKSYQGYEHDIIQAFAQNHGYTVKVKVFANEQEATQAVKKGKAQVLAIRLNQNLDTDLAYSNAYEEYLEQSIQIAFNKEHRYLAHQFNQWFIKASRQGKINEIRSRYFSHANELQPIDHVYINKNIRNRLPEYKRLFKSYGKQFSIPWTWIAAVAYQESKWQNDAQSFTGVRGLMQITWQTADAMGIEDRNDPKQSVYAGAKYLRMLMRRMPEELPVRERWIFALVAYNVGIAHLKDAQGLAEEKGLNPWSWHDIQRILPLLANPDYYTRLRYGYARGEEPVKFVKRVLAYTESLEEALFYSKPNYHLQANHL